MGHFENSEKKANREEKKGGEETSEKCEKLEGKGPSTTIRKGDYQWLQEWCQ